MKRYRPSIVIFIAAALSAVATGDTVYVGRLAYRSANVVDAKDFQLHYTIGGRSRVLVKPLSEVTRIQIDGRKDFNEAEDHVDGREDPSKWNTAAAIRSYDAAIAARAPAWLKRLVRYRKLRALGQSDRIDHATEAWLGLLQDEGASAALLGAKPTRIAPAGSAANTRAIGLLEDAFDEASDKTRNTIGDLLLRLYQREQKNAEAARLAGQIAGSQDPDGNGQDVSAVSTDQLSQRLRAQEILLRSAVQSRNAQKLSDLADDLRSGLTGYTAKHLPEALYLLSEAQYHRARLGGQPDTDLLKQAGLNYMRVQVFFPSSPRAASSLLMAGRVNEALGNRAAARKAYTEVTNLYPGTEPAKDAKRAAEALD
jgi:TolA-binding protein